MNLEVLTYVSFLITLVIFLILKGFLINIKGERNDLTEQLNSARAQLVILTIAFEEREFEETTIVRQAFNLECRFIPIEEEVD